MNVLPGSSRITADSVVGVSGKPVRLYSVSLISGGSDSVLLLKNGTGTSGTTYDQVDGVASKSTTKNYAGGLLFPGGLFADADANISSATFVFSTEI